MFMIVALILYSIIMIYQYDGKTKYYPGKKTSGYSITST